MTFKRLRLILSSVLLAIFATNLALAQSTENDTPTPYPTNLRLSKVDLDREMDPLWDALSKHHDPLMLADRVAALRGEMAEINQQYVDLARDDDSDHLQYLASELNRTFVSPNGLLKNVPFANILDAQIKSSVFTTAGQRARAGMNNLIAVDTVISAQCAANATKSCRRHVEEFKSDLRAAPHTSSYRPHN